jgi:hypothetical protein
VILFDTGPIVAAAFTTEDYYEACADLFAGLRLAGRRLLLPATVSAEAGYLIDRLGGPERDDRPPTLHSRASAPRRDVHPAAGAAMTSENSPIGGRTSPSALRSLVVTCPPGGPPQRNQQGVANAFIA